LIKGIINNLQIIIYIFLILIILFILVNYLRKLQWDAVHANLVKLEDEIGGKILRKSMLSRPVYHHKYKENDITINFSSERTKKGRSNYINFSFGNEFKNTFTISSIQWLEEREESTAEYEVFEKLQEYGIRKKDKINILKKSNEENFITILKNLDPFNYLFVGHTGILFERKCENLAMDTKNPKLRNTIDTLIELIKVIK